MQFSPQLTPAVKSREKSGLASRAKHRALARGYAAAMDIYDIRRSNLACLVERIATDAGSRRRTQKEVAISLDLSPSFMSQLLAGKRMGDDVARKIESALGLPYGVMDVPEGVQTGTPSRGSHVLRLDPETIAAALRLLRLTFTNLGVTFDNESDGTPLAYAYEYLAQRRERAVTPENLVDFSKRLAQRLQERTNHAPPTRNARSTG